MALEALRDFRQKHRTGLDDLWQFAKICRVTTVIRHYLEAFEHGPWQPTTEGDT